MPKKQNNPLSLTDLIAMLDQAATGTPFNNREWQAAADVARETLVKVSSPKQEAKEAVETLRRFIEGAREIYFSTYPKLPEGIRWGGIISGLVVLADGKEENLYLDVFLREEIQEKILEMPVEDLAKLRDLIGEQVTVARGIVASYEAIYALFSAYTITSE